MKTISKFILSWVVILCRALIGLLVIRTGFELIARKGSFVHWQAESNITGIFVIIIGAYFVFSSLLPKLFEKSE